ncbi:MAG: helix-turn-helix domain-containing protein [Candidatus Dormibacteraeota bacterium]|nr:helix-turn-helix domain-containing protein [Candidatus Dormibacteraeota bacterium]
MPDAEVQRPPLFEVATGPGRLIGKRLRLFESDGRRAVFFGPTAIHVYDVADKEAEAACIATLSRAGLASDVDIAAGFGVHRNTVGRIVRRFEQEGMAAVVPARRGPKGPSKATPEVMEVIAAHADVGRRDLHDRIIEATGVSLSLPYVGQLAALYRARQGELATDGSGEIVSSAEHADVAARTDGSDHDLDTTAPDDTDHDAVEGDDVDDGGDRGGGVAFDPPVTPPQQASGRYMGLALYYPALAAVGLLEAARSLFRLPRSERFGVRAVFQTLFFMTLLSKTTVESAKHLRRGEFGAMVGSGRAPTVKTLRRKLADLVAQAKAAEFGIALARRWVDGGIVATAYLYVDGHMKIYTGTRRLQEVWNSQRRMPLPGVHTYFVGDQNGRPLLFLTDTLSANLAKAMPRVVHAVREVVGDRAFTVIFDRGGYDGKLFTWLVSQGIGFITYQKGDPKRPGDVFVRRETSFEGRRVRFFVAEDEVKVAGTGPWRRIVVRTKDGHQTPIITTLAPDIGAARVACLMFARWRQENLFKYMGEHHGLDQLVSYAAEPAEPDTLIPNPQRKRLDRRLAELRKQAAGLQAVLGSALLDEPKHHSRSAHGLKIAQRGTVGELRRLEAEIDRLVAVRKPLPARVPVVESGTDREIMRLEHKAIVDRIKISAYNAEDWLCDRLIRHYPNPHDVRDLLRSFAELSGEIRTTDAGVFVTLDPPDTPIHRRALRGLVEDLSALGATFPGTDIPITYRVRVHHSETAA